MSLNPETLAESDDERSQELAAIAYSFPEELEILSPFSAILTLPVSPFEPLAVSFPSPVAAAPLPPAGPIRLHHLPSIRIKFALPPAYPTESPPFVELDTTPPWLPPAKLAALQKGCLELWEGYQVVYAVYDYVQQCIERGFDLDQPYQLPDALREPLLAFDAETKLALFNKVCNARPTRRPTHIPLSARERMTAASAWSQRRELSATRSGRAHIYSAGPVCRTTTAGRLCKGKYVALE